MANIIKALTRWKEVILLTALIRIALFVYVMIFDRNINTFFSRWVRWDGPHYIEIAKNGYQTIGEPALFIVFYPLYPLLVQISNFIIGNYETAAVLTSTFFSFTAAIALYELVRLDFNKRVAFLSVCFLNIFPVAYFLQAGYTESLFLTLSLLCIYFFKKEKFLLSGIIGILASLTRINGLLLMPILCMEIKKNRKSLTAFILLPLGFFIYLLINKLIFGSLFYFQQPLYTNWHKKFTFPWDSIRNSISAMPDFNNPNFYIYSSEIIAVFFLLVLTVLVFLKTKRSYGIYMLLNFLLITSTGFILSAPRYLLILFPVYIVFGLIKEKFILIFTNIIFLILLFYLTNLYTQGGWAF